MALAELVEELKASYQRCSSDCGCGLQPAVDDQIIDELELRLEMAVPAELRDLLRIHGGQEYIGTETSGLFGRHRLHSPREILEHHSMYQENCLFDPVPTFPPRLDQWGYWVPNLIPFASWDAYDLCIHSHRADVWEFCPNTGLTAQRPSIAVTLRELIEVVNGGHRPALIERGEEGNLRGMHEGMPRST